MKVIIGNKSCKKYSWQIYLTKRANLFVLQIFRQLSVTPHQWRFVKFQTYQLFVIGWKMLQKLILGVTSQTSMWPKINPTLYVIDSLFSKLRKYLKVYCWRVNKAAFDRGSKKFDDLTNLFSRSMTTRSHATVLEVTLQFSMSDCLLSWCENYSSQLWIDSVPLIPLQSLL